ncbi:MAG: glycosyltransferase [Rubrivivax sp.]|nr:MAG: glycosyltransferase [Rubrivivax sp.]
MAHSLRTIASIRLVRFALVGGLFMVANLALLHVLVHRLGMPYLWACILAFFALNALSYAFNKVFTFRLERKLVRQELLRFYLVMAASLTANLLLMYLLVERAGLGILQASAAVSALLAMFNFAGHALWTFRRVRVPPAQSPLKVMQVSAFYPAHGGGIEVVAGQLAQGLASQGVSVQWMAGGAASEAPPSAYPHLSITPAASLDVLERRLGLPMPMWSPSSLLALRRGIARADVVHVHDYLYLPSLLAICFAGLLGRPVVLTQHIGPIPFKSRLARALLHALNRTLGWLVLASVGQVVFVGQPVRRYFEARGYFRRAPLLIANGVDHARYQPSLHRPQSHPAVNFLFVGRFVEKKGLALLRQCMDLPGCRWTFIGGGALSPRGWGDVLPDHLVVLEGLRGEQVVPYYQQADLLVLPSQGEGFPLVVQEALACGTPVLVSREVGEAFPVLDPACVKEVELRCADPAAALRQAVQQAIDAPELLAVGRRHAAELSRQWSWEQCVTQYENVYRLLVGRDASVPDRVGSGER